MAQKVLVEILDDIDHPRRPHHPVRLDGVSYEIDLSEDNAAGLRDELARYISAARRVGGRKIRVATGQSTTSTSDRERNQQIRAWANANGYEVSERGRLSSGVIAAYEQAQIAEAEEPAKAPRRRAPRKRVAAAKK